MHRRLFLCLLAGVPALLLGEPRLHPTGRVFHVRQPMEGGKRLKMDDGSIWSIAEEHRHIVAFLTPGQTVTISSAPSQQGTYWLQTNTGENFVAREE